MLQGGFHVRCNVGLFVLLLLVGPVYLDGNGQFYGGSMSYAISTNTTTGKQLVNLAIITGWGLGKGPCGPGCTHSDVGRSTVQTRVEVENGTSDKYFGDWKAEFKIRVAHGGHQTKIVDLNSQIHAKMTETVIGVSEQAQWEQELMEVTLELEPNVNGEDITFDGSSWRNLTLQVPSVGKTANYWHIQVKMDLNRRNDTNEANASPKAFAKPYYRIRLNQLNRITIPAVDPDGDHIKCFPAQFVEAGPLEAAPGVDVNENCTITIDTNTSLGYKDDSWAAIAITIKDYNKYSILVGTTISKPVSFSLSGIAVQFLVQILETLYQPEFVSPTLENNHQFILYADATWTADYYAKASENATIEEFVVIALQKENVQQSVIKSDPNRPQTKFISLSWKPTTAEVGEHIVCLRAVENTGVDSAEDKCYTIVVKADTFTHSTAVAVSKPYFVDVPAYEQAVACNIDATCVLPVYVKSSVEVDHITISQNFVDKAALGNITLEPHNTDMMYKTDLSFKHSVDGMHKICMIATDKNGVESEETCIQTTIQPIDPCSSQPCLNSGVCRRSKDDPADYQCTCGPSYITGKSCEFVKNNCVPDPCNGGTCTSFPTFFYCTCPTGFTGETCDKSDTLTMLSQTTKSTTMVQTTADVCEDVPQFPCNYVSGSGYSMCNDESIANTHCRKTCGKCGRLTGSAAIIG